MEVFNVGDRVYHIGYSETKDLVVTKIVGDLKAEVEGIFVIKEKDGVDVEVVVKRVFPIIELTTKDPSSGVRIHDKDKWADRLVVIPNMGGVVKEMYEHIMTGRININPFYQRDLVWTLEQKQNYIVALYKEKARVNITTIVDIYSESDCYVELLDGKQRLSTICEFIDNKFALSDRHFFRDLHKEDMRYLLNLTFTYTRIQPTDKKVLTDNDKIELFLEINELGTKMHDEHIAKVKSLLK
ncbi:MAG: DUF262 domain-containing protein [Cetobacterium sp.]